MSLSRSKEMNLHDLKVLVVEDQSEARAMMKQMMLEMGITQIFEASDGREALSFIDSAYDFIDMVICDWNMPAMTGMELLRQLRTVDPDLPFLMVTGRGDKDSVVEAKSSGVSAYIRKPFSPLQLEAKLRVLYMKSQKVA